jgi:hypothetical protein
MPRRPERAADAGALAPKPAAPEDVAGVGRARDRPGRALHAPAAPCALVRGLEVTILTADFGSRR